MTKNEMIKALTDNKLSGDTEIIINIGNTYTLDDVWAEIGKIGKTSDGAPILIGIESIIMR